MGDSMISLLLLGLSAHAAPHGSETATLVFHDRVDAFDDVERELADSVGGSWGSVGFRIALESRGYTDTLLPATSDLTWPDPLSQTITGSSGHHEVNVNFTVVAQITFTLFGVPGSYDVWSRSLTLSGRSDFNGLLLPGSAPSSVTAQEGGAVLASYSTIWDPDPDLRIWFDIDVAPRVTSTFAGHRIESGDAFFTHPDEIALHPVPEIAPRSLNLDTGYVGQLNSVLDAVISPWVTACYYGAYVPICLDLDVDLPITLVNLLEDREFGKAYLRFPLPILRLDRNAYYFGEHEVGASESHQIAITNNGDLDLEVWTDLEGDSAFEVLQDRVVVDDRGTSFLEVTYTPRQAGTHEAELVLLTNDPEQPEVIYVLTGVAVDPPEPEPEPEPEEPEESEQGNFVDSGRSDFSARTCGCSTQAKGSSLGLIAILGVMALLGRRRRIDIG
ncbi:MAG: hypothetical protein EA397_10875 [Deltaproteobacteria bacterium]|nr:MAG: hypothetical protein EA397_10875 [Deltaproteobacteria bacterium]